MTPTNQHPARAIPPALRTRINVAAHQAAIQLEARLRGELFEVVQQALANGASIESAAALISTHTSQP